MNTTQQIKNNFGILHWDDNIWHPSYWDNLTEQTPNPICIYNESLGNQSFFSKKTSIKYLYVSQKDLEKIQQLLAKNTDLFTYKKRLKMIYNMQSDYKFRIRNLDAFCINNGNYQENYKSLWALIKSMADLGINLNHTRIYSTSSLAYYVFRKVFNKDVDADLELLLRLYPAEDDFIRKAFFGGRSGYNEQDAKEFYYYDINSSYPYVMRNIALPVGLPTTVAHLEEVNFSFSQHTFGFFEITFEVPENIVLPVLPIKENNKLSYPKTGTHRGVYFSEEIRLALSKKYKITFHQGYLFKKRIIAKDYVDYFYNLKKLAKNEKERQAAKCMLNYFFGSFSLNYKNSLLECTLTLNCPTNLDNSVLDVYPWEEIRPENLQYSNNADENMFEENQNENEFSEDLVKEINITGKKPKEIILRAVKSQPRNVSISAAVTSYHRVIFYDYLEKYNPIYYDTDSLLCNKPLDNTLMSNDELGKFKPVYKKKIKDFICIQIKFYALLFEDLSEKLIVRGHNETEFNWNFKQLKNDFIQAKKNKKKVTLQFKTGKTISFDIITDVVLNDINPEVI